MRKLNQIGALLLLTPLLFIEFNCKDHSSEKAGKQPEIVNSMVTFAADSTTMVNNKINYLDFYYHDSLAYGHPVIIGKRDTKLAINGPVLLFEASHKQTPFLIYPGDRIKIKYWGSDSVQMYIEGNAERTNELNFFRTLVSKTGNVYSGFEAPPNTAKVTSLDSVNQSEKAINSLQNKRLQFLSSYTSKTPVNANFIKIATNSIKSASISDSLLLYSNNRQLLNRLPLPANNGDMLPSQSLYQSLITQKTKSLTNIGFSPLQIYYMACTSLVSISTGSGSNREIMDSTDFKTMFNFAEKNFTGEIRDFLLANIIYKAYNQAIPVPNEYLHRFNTQCTNIGYKNLIAKRLNGKMVIVYPKGTNNLMFTDGKTVQDIHSVISKYKGKVILLDFWASWCAPCRAEMPYSAKLKKLYKGKNVAFVYVSTDDNIDDWEKANKEEALEKDNTYLFLNFSKSTFIKQNSINTIPRYILISKEGKVINNDAPRPSEPELIKLIDKHI